MSKALLASKIIVQEEPPQIRTIQAIATAIPLFVGVTERGPLPDGTVNKAEVVTSFEDYVKKFGGITLNAQDMPIAVEAFFNGGGARAYIGRVVHYTDITNGATKTSLAASATLQTVAAGATAGTVTGSIAEPFSLNAGDTLSLNIDGGGSDVATFDAAAATLTAGNTETFDLADGLTLTVKIDGGAVQTVTFNTAEFADIANATALEVAAVMNAELTGCSVDVSAGAPRITSDSQGTGSEIEVTGGTANSGGVNRLNFSTAPTNGTGDVANIKAVTAAEIKTVVEADVTGCTVDAVAGAVRITSNTTGITSSVQVEAASTADTALGFDNATHYGTDAGAANTLTVNGKTDGAYGNELTIRIEAATSGVSSEFNLVVERGGVDVEIWPNLSMDDAADNFCENVVNNTSSGSDLIAVVDLDAVVAQRPANGSFPMSGGSDGLTGLVDNDYIGSTVSKTGIRSGDYIDELSGLAVPGRATAAVHNSMITYCEVIRDMALFPVLDPPAGYTAQQMVDYVKTTASLKELSEFGAMYWPRIKIANPNTTVFGNVEQIVVPPSGHIWGMYARTDNAQPSGVSEAPAGVEVGRLFGVLGVETDEVNDEAARDLVFPELINPIVAISGLPVHVDGARTLKSTGAFPTIGERRLVIFIEGSLKRGTLFVKHRKIKRRTLKEVDRAWSGFLLIQTNNGAFASDVPAEAFFVDVSPQLNPPSLAQQRTIKGRVGLATAKPAEFVIIIVAQDQRALAEELALAA